MEKVEKVQAGDQSKKIAHKGTAPSQGQVIATPSDLSALTSPECANSMSPAIKSKPPTNGPFDAPTGGKEIAQGKTGKDATELTKMKPRKARSTKNK